jgi:hypothetical protein
MIDLIIISAVAGLSSVAIWLYLSAEQVKATMDVDTRLTPTVLLGTDLVRRSSRSKQFYRRIRELLARIAPFLGVALLLAVVPFVINLALPDSINGICITLLVVFGLLALAFGLWLLLRRRQLFGIAGFGDVPTELRYKGLAHIPLKAYAGDSFNITVDLSPLPGSSEHLSLIESKRLKDKDEVLLDLNISSPSIGRQEFLELELLAAGFGLEGDKKQRQRLTASRLCYQWNCFFENSGVHDFAIVFRVVSDADIEEVGRLEQSVKVVKIDHLTQRQVWILATIAGIVSGALAILEVAKGLGFW